MGAMGFSTHLKAFKKIRRRLNHPSTPVHSSHGPQAHTGHAILYCILVGVCGLSYAPVTQFKTKASMLHLLSILSLYQTLTNKRSNSPAMWYKILIWLKHLTHLYLYLFPTSIWLVVGRDSIPPTPSTLMVPIHLCETRRSFRDAIRSLQ